MKTIELDNTCVKNNCDFFLKKNNSTHIYFRFILADTTLDIKYARFKKGGAIKYIGYFSAIGSCISVALSLIGMKTQ